MTDYKYKYILRDSKTSKYKAAYDSYIKRVIDEAQDDYEREKEYDEDAWYFGGYYEPINGVYVYKVIEYKPDGIGKTPTGKEWHIIAEGHDLPDNVYYYKVVDGHYDEPAAKKEFMSTNPDIGHHIKY